ncbi:MAG: ammonium transporter [Candidatus Brocadiaceae bacterium]|nr:ammonium transporter [Candidatus Brocadiaceae bacterium]
MRKTGLMTIMAVILIMVTASIAWAGEDVLDTGDNAWILTSAALVLLMTPGLAFFYGGMCSVKNIVNMLMMVFMGMSIISVQWVFWGYSLSFGPDCGSFIGSLSMAGLRGITPDSLSGTISEYTFLAFQATFAIITVGLIMGAVEGRMKFSTFLIFIPLWSTAVYDPVCHWVWGGGFLGAWEVLDFAGGTVVHINSAAAALALVILLGKRKPQNIRPPCNVPMVLLGTGLLWFGWFGFNAGSELAADGRAAFAWVITNTAAATACFVWTVCEWIHRGKPTLIGAASGAIAGLVAITPAAGFVGPLGAVQIGIMSGIGCYFASMKLKKLLGYDDALDVVGVHGVGGTIGAFATGLYCTKMVMGPDGVDGLFIGWGAEGAIQLGKQCVGFVVAWAYAFCVTMIIGLFLKGIMGLRTTEQQENTGLDLTQHGEGAYHLETESLSTLKAPAGH